MSKKAIIKRARPDAESRIKHEADILKLLNKYKIGPKLLEHKNNQLIEEYIEGETIEKFIESNLSSNKKAVIKVMKQILNQCRTLDKLKLNKEEMSNPYKHILLERRRDSHSKASRVTARESKRIALRPVMIDFERARFSESPANVTQFFQYLMHYKLVKLDEETKQLLKNYKNTQSEKDFKKLLDLL